MFLGGSKGNIRKKWVKFRLVKFCRARVSAVSHLLFINTKTKKKMKKSRGVFRSMSNI